MVVNVFGEKKGEHLDFFAELYYKYRRLVGFIQIYLIMAGPGILVMVADNDAGSITTYTATGAQFGYNLIWFLILLGPIAYFVQEMTVRLGAVTKHGHAEAIFTYFGYFWGWFSSFDLSLINWLTLITEFIGMTAALHIFGVPPVLTVIVVIFLMMFMVLHGRYWTWEKLALTFSLINLIYVPLAFMVHPQISQVINNGIIPRTPAGGITSAFLFILMADVGTTVAPWMIFFQQSTVVDKGMTEKDIPFGKLDTFLGSILTVVCAVFVTMVTGQLLFGTNITDAGAAASALMGMNKYWGTMLAIGLFDAGLLGAICISLTTSWAFGEVFGWAHSLNRQIREAPWFYGFYAFGVATAAMVVLIPAAPLVLITIFVQVISVTLLPAAMVFLILILNNKDVMGKYTNTLTQNAINLGVVFLLILVSTGYAIITLFPHLF
jgi:Mn2+/Fe2+ NRAMP family transporter